MRGAKRDDPHIHARERGGQHTRRLRPRDLTAAAARKVCGPGDRGRSLPRTGSDGHGYDLARSLGHSIVPTTPALVPLLLDGDVHDGLAGVAHEVRATVTAGRDRRGFDGPMLWTHVGVSGPAILDASRHWLRHALEGTGARVSIQSTPGEFADLERWIIDAACTNPRATAPSLLSQRLPAAIAERVSRTAGADSVPLASLDWPRRRALVHALTDLPLPVRDSRGYDHAEATAGGVALTEVDAATMASRTCPGLFLIGEMLDVDGRLGGFNFQWAWSSAVRRRDGRRAGDLTLSAISHQLSLSAQG